MKDKLRNKIAFALFIVFLPVTVTLYFLDRQMLVFMFWIRPPKFTDYLTTNNKFWPSVIRGLALFIIYLIYYLL